MSAERECPECGAALPAGVLIGQCPNCLLSLGLGIPDDDPGATKPEGRPVQPAPSAINSGSGAKARTFGDYELLEEIARGGMGVVYKARQRSLNRVVALKMILSGQFASKQEVLRFRSEAEAAANLRHPNIVAIYETGESDGQHYFSMEFVEGRSLAEIGRDGPLPAQRAARYAKVIAEAIHYAHQQGTLHRDLKPSNVLIDANDQPRVTDFGLAKRIRDDFSLTGSGQMLGSPSYMPPEQCGWTSASERPDAPVTPSLTAHPIRQEGQDEGSKPRRLKIGPSSDVYSLGATLYYLLTGRPPFVAEALNDTLHQLLHADPVPPRLLNPSVPLDLQTICLKCLEKAPVKRYPTSQALADELGRFLNDEPIRARPVSRLEKAWRWCRRKPAIATLILAVHLVGAMGLAGILWQWRRAETSATNERHEHHVAEGRLYAAQMKLAHAAYKTGKIGGALKLLRAQPPGFRGFEWRYMFSLCLASESSNEILAANNSGFTAVDYSPDQGTVALGTGDGGVEVYDVQSRQRMKRWPAHSGPVDVLVFHPTNANWLVSVCGDDGLLKLWDVGRQQMLLSTNGPKGLFARAAISPGGNILASCAPDGVSVNFWDFTTPTTAPPTLSLRTNLNLEVPLEMVFAPDNHTVALCKAGALWIGVALYDLTSGGMIQFPVMHSDLISSAAFSPDGSLLATGGSEQVIVWDTKKHIPIHTKRTGLVHVTSMVFAPDGQNLFASGWDQNLLCWNLGNHSEPMTLRGHSGAVNALALAEDGSWLVSAGRDGTARLWDLRRKDTIAPSPIGESSRTLLPADTSLQTQQEAVFAVAVSPTQDKLAAGTRTHLVLFDLVAGTELARVTWNSLFETAGTNYGSCGVAFSPDGRALAVGSGIGTLALVDAVTLKCLKPLAKLHKTQIWRTAYGLDGSVVVTGGGFGDGIAVSDTETGHVTRFAGIEGLFPEQPLAVSRNGQLLAFSSPEQFVVVRDLASGQVLARCRQQVRFLHAVTFSPDGRLVAYSDELGGIFLWDFSGQRPLRTLVGHSGPVLDLAFSPDGGTLASASMDHTIKLWHPEIEQEVATLEGHSGWVWCIAFAEKGNTLVSGSGDGSLRVWRSLSFEEIEAKENAKAARGPK